MNKFVILIFLIIVILNNQFVKSQIAPIQNPQNGHWYEVVQETLDGINATLKCSSKTYNGLKGYLATFTSEDEWNWAMGTGIAASGAWMSGSDAIKTGFWHWSAGSPEQYQPMYNLYFDRCYTFCLFGNVEPNLIPNEHWVHTSGSNGIPYWNNNAWTASILKYICEYGGLEDPFIPASPTTGSTVAVSNLAGYDISKLKITFSGRDGQSQFLCSSIVKINSTHANCNIPAGQGRYTYIVTDNTKTSSTQYWHYELPYVGGVYPSFTANSKVTITGANFGIDASKISITLGGTPNVTCNNIILEKPNEALTCVLSAAITEKFLPVTITVSNSKFISYKSAVYYPTNLKYYSGFVSSSTFDLSMNNYSAQLRIDGQVGHIGVLDSVELANFVLASLPIPISKADWILWQNVYYNPPTGNFLYLTGPKKDQTCTLYYLNTDVDKTLWTTATRFIINLNGFIIAPSTGSASTFTEFGGYAPTFTYPGKVQTVSPAGGVVGLQIDNYGTVFSTISVTFKTNQVLSFTRDFINSELDVTIPPGFDGPYDISVIVDGLKTPNNTQSISYYAPVIQSITRIPTTGGLVTISGQYFSNVASNIVVNFGSISCTNIAIVSAYSAISCTLPASTGVHSVSVKISQQTSAEYSYSFSNPIVTKSNNIPQIGGVVTIEGTNFGTVASNINVTIGSYKCTGISIITPHTKISCTAPTGTPNTYGLVVTVSTLDSNPFSMYIFNSNRVVTQVGSDVVISGTALPTVSTLSILIGSIDITTSCSGDSSTITCSNLPNTVVSGDLSMFKGSDVYPIIPVVLNPYISAISKTMLDTVATTTITLTGRYFESSTNGETNSIVVIQNNEQLASSSFKWINSQSVEVYINGGFGANINLSVKVATRESNKVTFSFYAPELLTVTQIGSTITVVGRNLSSNSDLTFGVYQPILTSVNSNTIVFELSSTSRNGEIFVVVQQQKSNIIVLNLTPSLNEVVLPKPNVVGPTEITVSGNYLYKVDAKGAAVSLNFYYQFTTISNTPAKLLDCTASQTVENTYLCNMVSGYGYFNIYAVSNSVLNSNIISNLQYVSPVVGDAQPIYFGEPGNVTIAVSNIGSVEYTTIKIGGDKCDKIFQINQTTVKCYFEATTLYSIGKSALNISVVSAGLSGFKDNAFSYSPLYSCPKDCSDNGICNEKTGLCSCSSGFEGIDCSNRTCPNQCTSPNNGICDVNTGLCGCSTGFEGIDCSNRTCPNQCTSSDNGICNVVTGECQCKAGFEDVDCSDIICPNRCTSSDNGVCDPKTGVCGCLVGFEGHDCSNKTCPNQCSGHGICDVVTGLCSCDSNWNTTDCSNDMTLLPCPNNCTSSDNGVCDRKTGLCGCLEGFEGIDCSNKTCLNDCTSLDNGICDSTSGLCQCLIGFEGTDCSNKTCPNKCTSSDRGTCDVNTGLCQCLTGFEGFDCSNQTCPNNCSNQGICDKSHGKCFCYSGFGGVDCSIQTTKNPELPPPFIDENGQTTFPGTNLNISVAITHLRENDFNDNLIKVLRMKDINWIERSNISTNYYYYKGKWDNDSAIFELVVKYFENEDQIVFAGETLNMPDNSIKYQVTITEWSFENPLNYLETIYHSKTGISSTYKCDEVISTSIVGTSDYQIETGESTFNAKFASKVIIDDTKFISTSIKALDQDDVLYNDIGTNVDKDFSLLTSIYSPSFNHSLVLDPLFSSLFKTVEKTECSTDEKWKLPVIIVLSTVGGVSIAVASFFLVKHKLMAKKLQDSISMSTRS